MKKPALLLSLSALWCLAVAANGEGASSRAPKESIATKGEPYELRIEGRTLTFCDKRGRRKLDLDTGREDSVSRTTCAQGDQPNTACDGLALDVTVRGSLAVPDDIVDVGGSSFPLKGRVHDCAADRKMLAIVTASVVVLIDAAKLTSTEINRPGGDRVTIGSGWVAWTYGSNVRVRAFDRTGND